MPADILPQTLGSDRFLIRRQIGRGGMGVVYEAYDRERDHTVALKTLKGLGAGGLYRFKQEFRSLSDIVHPNLVTLYELFASDDLWFFTMELIDGVSFLEYMRGGRHPAAASTTGVTRPLTAPTLPAIPSGGHTLRMVGSSLADPGFEGGFALNVDRIWPCLRQLADGIHALHDSGHLHGDINPSNVMVEHGERVVVLDFGIISELAGNRTQREGEEIVGTPAYMAPEQFKRAQRPSPATDWYAFGVTLYELLTGRRPYLGSADEIIAAKLVYDPIAPTGDGPLQPLAVLCTRLLHRNPAERPTGPEIIEWLARDDTRVAAAPTHAHATTRNVQLLGRDRELAILQEAYRDLTRSVGSAVLVSGRSGMGKSALVHEFLDELAAQGGTIVLAGRCYERESVPYKALDSLVDALYRYLAAQPPDQVARITPGDASALVQAFPVLAQLPAFGPPGRNVSLDEDRAGLRRRAFNALRDLLAGLARSRPLVMFIDDLQWGDVDSAPFLLELVLDSGMPLLFVGSYRSEDKDSSRLLRTLASSMARSREIQVGELAHDQLAALAAELLEQLGAPTDSADRIAREAQGSPFFAYELARHAAAHTGGLHDDALSLDDVIMARVRTLSTTARRLLEVVAVAGMRLPQALAERVAEVDSSERRVLLELNAGRFVRTTGARESDTVEPYHDRIREALLGHLSDSAQREIHGRIAQVLETERSGDPEEVYALAHHYFYARRSDQAARAFELNQLAGQTAAASYAHEQAHQYFDQARRIADDHGLPCDARFEFDFGDACARTGRVELAAASFQTALTVTHEPVPRARLFLGLSKVFLGQLDAGRARAHAAGGLAELGYKRPVASLGDIVKSLWAIWRGRRIMRKPLRLASGEDRDRLHVVADLYMQASMSGYFEMDRLGMVQIVARLFRVGARLGPSRALLETYVMSSVIAAIAGRPALSNRFMARALDIDGQVQDPGAKARLHQYSGHIAHFLGDAPKAAAILRDAIRDHGQFLENMDLFTAIADLAWNLMMRGHAREAWAWIERGLRRSALGGEQSGLAHGHTYRCYAGPLLAVLGRSAEGRAHLDKFEVIIAPSPDDRWRWGQYLGHRILYEVECGELGEELERLIERHAAMRLVPKRLPLSMRHVYVAIAYARLGQCEASTADRPSAVRKLRTALRDLERASGQHPTLRAHLLVISAGLAAVEDRVDRCEQLLSSAERIADAQDNAWVRYQIAVARAQLARRLGHVAAADRHVARASALADEHGWPSRAARAQAMRASGT